MFPQAIGQTAELILSVTPAIGQTAELLSYWADSRAIGQTAELILSVTPGPVLMESTPFASQLSIAAA